MLLIDELKSKWTVGDSERVVMEVRANGNNVVLGEHHHTDKASDLIAVNDSLFLKLISPDGSFKIYSDNEEVPRKVKPASPLIFTWGVKAVKAPSTDSTTLIIVPHTLDCDGIMTPWPDRPYKVKVSITTSDKIDEGLSWIEKHLTKLLSILGLIAGVLAYFKGWFGKLFGGKKAAEE